MLIMGRDLHTRYQEIALLDTATGEGVTRRLGHENGGARAFYAGLPEPGSRGACFSVRVESSENPNSTTEDRERPSKRPGAQCPEIFS